MAYWKAFTCDLLREGLYRVEAYIVMSCSLCNVTRRHWCHKKIKDRLMLAGDICRCGIYCKWPCLFNLNSSKIKLDMEYGHAKYNDVSWRFRDVVIKYNGLYIYLFIFLAKIKKWGYIQILTLLLQILTNFIDTKQFWKQFRIKLWLNLKFHDSNEFHCFL